MRELIKAIKDAVDARREITRERNKKIATAMLVENEDVAPNLDRMGRFHAPCDGYHVVFEDDYGSVDGIYGKGQFIPIPKIDNEDGWGSITSFSFDKTKRTRILLEADEANDLMDALNFIKDEYLVAAKVGQEFKGLRYVYISSYFKTALKVVDQYVVDLKESAKAKREEEFRITNEKKIALSHFVGEPKKRMEFVAVVTNEFKYTVNPFHYYDTGERKIVELTTEDGAILIYRGEYNPFGDKGEQVKFKATIKEHSEYKGIKQNVVQRPKVIEEEENA